MRIILIILVGLVLGHGNSYGQNEKDPVQYGLNYFTGTFGEANALALEEDKAYMLLIQDDSEEPLYKYYIEEVFTDSAVVTNFNEHFVCLTAAKDSDNGKNLIKQFQVTTFPAIFFVSQEGELLYTISSKMDPDQLVDQIQRSVLND